jgi:hypothetical protein
VRGLLRAPVAPLRRSDPLHQHLGPRGPQRHHLHR